MNVLSFRHYGYRPQPHCTTMKDVNKGTWRRDKKTESEREQFCKHMICNFNFPGLEPVFMFCCNCFCQNENEKNKRE